MISSSHPSSDLPSEQGWIGDDILDGGNGIDVVDGLWQIDTCLNAETTTRREIHE